MERDPARPDDEDLRVQAARDLEIAEERDDRERLEVLEAINERLGEELEGDKDQASSS